MTAVRTSAFHRPVESPAPPPVEPVRRSEVGAPEVVDPQRARVQLWATMALVVAGLALTLWALTDSLQGSRGIELERLDVPSVQDLDIVTAQRQLEAAGFVVQLQFQPNDIKPKGQVIGQDPLAGSRVEQGELIVITASDGPRGLSIPDVEGQQAADAAQLLQATGILVELVPTPSETVRPEEVIGTDPAIGSRVPTSGVVKLLVSSGPAPRTVPLLLNKPIEQALAEIGRSGLAVGDIDRVFRQDLLPGTVFEVNPGEGAAVPRDTPVDLRVAGPEPTSTVPYLVGLHQASAEKAARTAGVAIKVITTPVAAGDPLEGRVISQGTPPQTELRAGQVVEITVAVVPAPPPTSAPAVTTPAPPASAPG